jgi:hypothetical protein
MQRDPVDELHYDGRADRRFDVLVQPDHVRVIEPAERDRLSAAHLGEIRVVAHLGRRYLIHRGRFSQADPAEPLCTHWPATAPPNLTR